MLPFGRKRPSHNPAAIDFHRKSGKNGERKRCCLASLLESVRHPDKGRSDQTPSCWGQCRGRGSQAWRMEAVSGSGRTWEGVRGPKKSRMAVAESQIRWGFRPSPIRRQFGSPSRTLSSIESHPSICTMTAPSGRDPGRARTCMRACSTASHLKILQL